MKNYPKIELHCHLDGSLRPSTVKDLTDLYNVQTDTNTIKELKEKLIAPANCDSLVTYLKRFDLPIAILQCKEALTRVAYELMEDAALENVKYIEIRFAPQQHIEKGLSLDEVISSVLEGIREGEDKHDIKGNLILSYLRHTDVDGMIAMIDAGKKYLGRGVVAVDLCSAELENFANKFIQPISYARDLGYQVTIHAGETGISKNVIDAIELLKADRIGHGVAIVNDPVALKKVKDMSVTIEACPTSNIQTKAVTSIEEHPIQDFLDQNILVTVNTDNRTVSDTTMTKEYALLNSAFDWDEEQFMTIYETSVNASYADKATKEWLLTFLTD